MPGDDNSFVDEETVESLTHAVKSAILDRLLSQLGAEYAVGAQRSIYTKSDSGLYGKYEKQDSDPILTLLHDTIEAIVADFDSRSTPVISPDPTTSGND